MLSEMSMVNTIEYRVECAILQVWTTGSAGASINGN